MSYQPSEDVKRIQKLIEAIDQRKQERARLISDKLRRGVEIEREGREDLQLLRDKTAACEEECRKSLAALRADYDERVGARAGELNARQQAIEDLDTSLAQLRKQLEVELGKVDPELRKGA